MLTSLRSSSPVLVMISIISVLICIDFHARQANSGKITSFWGTSLSAPSSQGIPSLSSMKFCREILDTPGYHTVKTPNLYLTWAWTGTGM